MKKYIAILLALLFIGCSSLNNKYFGGKIGKYPVIEKNTTEGGYDVSIYLYFTKSTDKYTVNYYTWDGQWIHQGTGIYSMGKKYGKIHYIWVNSPTRLKVVVRAIRNTGDGYGQTISFQKEFTIK